jgi:hypothetical protein
MRDARLVDGQDYCITCEKGSWEMGYDTTNMAP